MIVVLGCGFIGKHIVESLGEVRVLFHSGVSEWYTGDAVVGDASDATVLDSVVNNGDTIINLVRFPNDSPAEPIKAYMQLLREACVRKKCKLIHFSTAVVYGSGGPYSEDHDKKPLTSYAKNKWSEEQQLEGFPCIIFRPTTVYGKEGRGFLNVLLRACQTSRGITLNNQGTSVRDFIHISDVVEFVHRALEIESGVFNISTGVGTSLIDATNYVKDNFIPDLSISYNPEQVFEESVNIGDSSRANKELEYLPKISIFKGIDLLFSKL